MMLICIITLLTEVKFTFIETQVMTLTKHLKYNQIVVHSLKKRKPKQPYRHKILLIDRAIPVLNNPPS